MARGWRWLYWIQLILAGVAFVLITFTVPETYAPILLSRRAAKLRKLTGDTRYTTEQELDQRPFTQRLRVFLIRPFQLLFGELIVFFVSLYMSVLYGLLYMFFVAVSHALNLRYATGVANSTIKYPIVFQEGKKFTAGSTGLMFIPIGVGVMLGCACSPSVNKWYLKTCRKHGGKPPAEARLVPMMVFCWFIPVGLFIFAGTSSPHLSWVGPALGGFPVGFGFIFLYNAANNYIGECRTCPAVRRERWLMHHSGFVSTPSCIWARRQDVLEVHLGGSDGSLHCANVPPCFLCLLWESR